MDSRSRLCRVAVSLILIAVASHTLAEIENCRVSPYLHVEQFKWEESIPAGDVEESGPLFGLGAELQMDLPAEDLLLNGKGEFFFGETGYDGVVLDIEGNYLRSLDTDVEYKGITLEADVAYRLDLENELSINPFGGLGIKRWDRDIGSEYGYDESWLSLYLILGVAASRPLNSSTECFGSFALRYPLHNKVDYDGIPVPADSVDASVNPGEALSFRIDAGANMNRFRVPLRITVFYETLDFSKSSTDAGYYQPASEAAIMGLTAGTTL